MGAKRDYNRKNHNKSNGSIGMRAAQQQRQPTQRTSFMHIQKCSATTSCADFLIDCAWNTVGFGRIRLEDFTRILMSGEAEQ